MNIDEPLWLIMMSMNLEHGDPASALHNFKESRNFIEIPGEKMVSMAITALCKMNKAKRAISLLSDMKTVSEFDLDPILENLAKFRKWEQLLQIFQEFSEKGISFSTWNCNLAVKAVVMTSGINAARNFIEISKIPLDDDVYDTMMKSAYLSKRKPRKILEIFEEFQRNFKRVSPVLSARVIHAVLKLKKWDVVVDILKQGQMDGPIWGACMSALHRDGRYEVVAPLYDEAMAQGIVGGMQTKVPMLDSIFRMEGIQATRSAFDEMSKISELDDDSWNAMMSMYANAGDTAEVIRLFEMRRKTAKKISMPIWKTSLAAMIKDGRPDEAIQILQNETGTTDVTLDAIQILIGPATKT